MKLFFVYFFCDWLIDWCFFMHAGSAVSRSGRWFALYVKNLVTLLYWYRQINLQWSIDRLACSDRLAWSDGLMFLMHAGLAVSRSGRWLALYGNKLVTVLYWHRQINLQWSIDRLACSDRLAWSDGLMFLMHAGLAVSRSGRWLALYGKNGVTALEVRYLCRSYYFLDHCFVTDPDPKYFAGSWSAVKACDSDRGLIKRFIVFLLRQCEVSNYVVTHIVVLQFRLLWSWLPYYLLPYCTLRQKTLLCTKTSIIRMHLPLYSAL